VEVLRPLSDDSIVRMAGDAAVAVTAIDAPLGWPAAFVRSVAAYGLGGPFPDPGEDLWLRATDRVVWAAVGRRPLSVSSDRIAYPAVRAARLLSRLGPDRPARRDGSDGIIEVYPAGALAAWGIDPGRYKRPDALDVRRSRTRWTQPAILTGSPTWRGRDAGQGALHRDLLALGPGRCGRGAIRAVPPHFAMESVASFAGRAGGRTLARPARSGVSSAGSAGPPSQLPVALCAWNARLLVSVVALGDRTGVRQARAMRVRAHHPPYEAQRPIATRTSHRDLPSAVT